MDEPSFVEVEKAVVEKPYDALEAYRRVMLDHTELMTRVGRIDERARFNSCALVINFIMVVVVGGYSLMSGASTV